MTGVAVAATLRVDGKGPKGPTHHIAPKRYLESVGVTTTRVTSAFLFTDIEASTRRWEQYPDAMMTVIAQHDALLDEVEARGGAETYLETEVGITTAELDGLRARLRVSVDPG